MVRVIPKCLAIQITDASLCLTNRTLFPPNHTPRLGRSRGVASHVLDDDARVGIVVVFVVASSSSPRDGGDDSGRVPTTTHRGGRFRESVWVRSTRVDDKDDDGDGDGERDDDGDDDAWTWRTGHCAGIYEQR
jgi:hypothetical protein